MDSPYAGSERFAKFREWLISNSAVADRIAPDRRGDWAARLAELDRRRAEHPPQAVVCLLGTSGIGKSTLVNALFGGADTVLPAGGLGPLTAQAVRVRHGAAPRLRVNYLDKDKIKSLMAGVATIVRKPSVGDGDGMSLKQANLLFAGDQNAGLTTRQVEVAFEYIRNPARTPGEKFSPERLACVAAVRKAMEIAYADRSHDHRPATLDDRNFHDDVWRHATGCLAPLVKELEVTWPTELLVDGPTLVDLPGVGIATDSLRDTTTAALRADTDIVLLVVGKRGVTDDVAVELRNSRFFNRLGWEADLPAERSAKLMVVAVCIEWVAEDLRETDRNKSLAEHCRAAADQLKKTIRRDVGGNFEKVLVEQQNNQPLGDGQRKVLDRLTADVAVHAVSARQYRRILGRDPDNKPIPGLSEEDTGIPALAADLTRVAVERRRAWEREIRRDERRLEDEVLAALVAAIASTATCDKASQRLREEIGRSVESFRKRLERQRQLVVARQGAFGAFWRETLPTIVEKEIFAAAMKGRDRCQAYTGRLSEEHWSRLQAAMNGGGRHDNIDFAAGMAIAYDGALAERWGAIHKAVSDRVAQFMADRARLVAELRHAAVEDGLPALAERIDAFAAALNADTIRLREIVDAANRASCATLNLQLVEAITLRGQIRSACLAFVDAGQNKGTGLQERIRKFLGLWIGEGQQVFLSESRRRSANELQGTREAVLRDLAFQRDPIKDVEALFADLTERTLAKAAAAAPDAEIAAALAAWKAVAESLEDAE